MLLINHQANIFFKKNSENKLSQEYDTKSKEIMQSIEDDLERTSQKYIDEKK